VRRWALGGDGENHQNAMNRQTHRQTGAVSTGRKPIERGSPASDASLHSRTGHTHCQTSSQAIAARQPAACRLVANVNKLPGDRSVLDKTQNRERSVLSSVGSINDICIVIPVLFLSSTLCTKDTTVTYRKKTEPIAFGRYVVW